MIRHDPTWSNLKRKSVVNFSHTVGCISYKEQHQAATWWNSEVLALCSLWSFLAFPSSERQWSGVSTEVSLPPMPPKDGHQGKTVVVSCMDLMHAISCNYNCYKESVIRLSLLFFWLFLVITWYSHISWYHYISLFAICHIFGHHSEVIIPFRDRESHLILFKLPDRSSSIGSSSCW